MVTLRVGFSGFVAGGRAACGCGDAVSDGDLLGPDEDVSNQQPQHSLAVFDSRGSGAGAAMVCVRLPAGVPGAIRELGRRGSNGDGATSAGRRPASRRGDAGRVPQCR